MDFGALLEQIANGPLGTFLYPLYLILVFLTANYLALAP